MRSRFRPRIESLESRRLLAVLTVTSAADSIAPDGSLTLREAVLAANTNASVDGSTAGDPGADVIEFAAELSGVPIVLTGGALQLNESIEIKGSGAGESIIDGNGSSRIFSLNDNAGEEYFVLSGLTLQNGVAQPTGPGESSFGGAIWFDSQNGSRLELRDSLLKNNRATVGGALHLRRTISLIDRTTVSDNAANFGGGISLQDSNVTVTNSTITGNLASEIGGGIDHFSHLTGAVSTLDLVHVTLVDNDAPLGRNLRNGADGGAVELRFANSIIYGQSSVSELLQDEINGTAIAISRGGNLTDHSVPNAILTPHDQRIIAFANNILPLQNNGGTTPTRALHPLDFAVDRGLNALAVGPGDDLLMGTADDTSILFDQRGGGFARTVNGGSGAARVDAGAFEIQDTLQIPQTLVVSNLSDELFPSTTTDLEDLSLREAIQLSNLKSGTNTIEFSESIWGQAIVLSSGRSLFVYDALQLQGPGADKMTIDANRQSRHFVFQADEELGITFSIDSLTFIGGMAPSAGGAIFAWRNHLVVKNSHFEDNTSVFAGGAIFTRNMVADIVNSSFTGNHSPTNGGAIGNLNSDLTLTGVTAIYNSADQSAGAVHVRVSNPDDVRATRIVNATFAGNSAPVGADVVIRPDAGLEGRVEFANSIFASSVFGTDAIINTLPDESVVRLASLGNNLVIDDSILGLDPTDHNRTDPRLNENVIRLNGVDCLVTQPGSPAHDAANESLVPLDRFDLDGDDETSEPLPFDGLGQARSVVTRSGAFGGPTDIGAYELPASWQYVGHSQSDAVVYRHFDAAGVSISIELDPQWTNPLNRVDVKPDGNVGPLDALIVINAIARGSYFDPQTNQLGNPADYAELPDFFFDVNADGKLTPIDALNVINHLARQSVQGEGEGEVVSGQAPIRLSVAAQQVDRLFQQFNEHTLF